MKLNLRKLCRLKLREKFLNWLLSGAKELQLPSKVRFGNSPIVITSDFIDMATLTADPSLVEGRFWYRADRKVPYIALPARLGLVDYSAMKGIRPGRYYSSMFTALALTTFTLSANILYAVPMLVPRDMPVDRIAFNVTTAGASGTRGRAGIYIDDGTLYPGSLCIDGGEFGVDTVGVKEATISFTLIGGVLYWLVLVSSGAPTVRAVAVGGLPALFDLDATMGTAVGIGWTVSFTYAALPSTYPAGGTIWSPAAAPCIALRRA